MLRTHYRGCVTVTAHTINTWGKAFLIGLGTGSVSDIGPNIALLGPNGRACGDSNVGTVRLTATATASVTWYLNGMDQDYNFVGPVCSTSGASIDTVFAASPDFSDLEMCVHNSSQQTITASYELSAA